MPRWWDVYVPWVPQRYVMCALAAWGTMVGWMVYYCGFNAIYELKISPPRNELTGTGGCSSKLIENGTADSTFTLMEGWNESFDLRQALMFWVPFSVSSVVSGLLADKVGPRQVWPLGALLNVFSASLVAPMVRISTNAALACIAVCGIASGAQSPCSSVLVAYWAAEHDRTIFVAFIESALFVGLMADFLLHSHVVWDEGWETWLYVSCATSIVWILTWYILFYNHPAEHPHITSHELQYLKTRPTGSVGRRDRKTTVPWKHILSSPPFVSLVLASVASALVQSLLGYHMMMYLLYALNQTSILVEGVDATGMTYGAAFVSAIIHGWISDKLISNGITSRTANRRVLLVPSNHVSAVLLLAIPLLERNTTCVITVFYLIILIQGVGFAAMYANTVDLSPQHAGLLRGLQSGIRALTSVFWRQLVYSMVYDPADYGSWAPIFYVAAVTAVLLSFPYACFGSGNIQAWNDYVPQDERARTTQNPSTPEPLGE